ncbi:hypothetical protein [Agromyces bauzanensis]|uniref:Nucleotidyltransferase family protein n=1 Tax=Agromyces bauzanensis TaxID=1308924 RepID=A0A917UWQ3_9MICO|nr:hypothetical protein [Agromyces bauzanensis]GGJ90430.1 hypothetical protein GCM10011372_31220 [Agromyces bauzanensis]
MRLHLGRAAVQVLADRSHIDLLHIKGDAVESAVRPLSSPGSDVDVLVRPEHTVVLDHALRSVGWRIYSTFLGGSPFGHAQTYLHETWGFLDMHRSFPGIGIAPSPAFERLWAARRTIEFAGVDCPVPSLPAQSVIVILNAARARRPLDPDGAWNNADRRREIEIEIDELKAGLAFDAAFGRIDDHRGAREYRLWKATTEGGGRVEEWLGRVQAAPTVHDRIVVVLRAPLVNKAHLEHALGRRPSPWDIVREFFARPARGIRELLRRRSLGPPE